MDLLGVQVSQCEGAYTVLAVPICDQEKKSQTSTEPTQTHHAFTYLASP